MLTLAYNIILFPPLYFWCFFYYTEVVSVNIVLLMLLLHQRKQVKKTAFVGNYLILIRDILQELQINKNNVIGLIGILVRQTNIIWLGFFAIEHALDIFDRRIAQSASLRVLSTPLHFRVSKRL